MEPTSVKAYKEIQSQIASLQEKVLDALQNKGPMTARELDKELGGARSTAGRRLSELKIQGKVCKGPARRCSITGRSAIEWRLGGTPQQELPKPPTSKQAKAILKELSEML